MNSGKEYLNAAASYREPTDSYYGSYGIKKRYDDAYDDVYNEPN